MTREEIIQGLQFTIDMFLLDPNTGETYEEPRNDMDLTTINACRGAIELLEQEPKIKVLDRDEAMRKLGTIDIYQASAWNILLKDLEYLKLKICKVEDLKKRREQMKTLSEWNDYLEHLKQLRDRIYEGTKTTEGLCCAQLSMEDCDIIWDLLSREANTVFNTPLEFHRK